MILLIFPIIISLSVMGLLVFVLSKAPRLVKLTVPVGVITKPASSLISQDNMVQPDTTTKKLRLSNLIKSVFFRLRQLKLNTGFTQGLVGFFKIWFSKINAKLLVGVRKRWHAKRGLARQGGDFKELKELFRQKRTPLLLSEPITKKPDSVLEVVEQKTDGDNITFEARLDFNKFLTNGVKKNKEYHLRRFSFDKILNKKLVKTKKLTPGQELVAVNGLPTSDEALEQKQSLGSKDDKLRVFVSQEQDLIRDIAQNPHDDKLYIKLGELYLSVKNWQDAQVSFEYALKLNPRGRAIQKSIAKIKKLLHN